MNIDRLVHCLNKMKYQLTEEDLEEIFVHKIDELNQLTNSDKMEFVGTLNNRKIIKKLIKEGFDYDITPPAEKLCDSRMQYENIKVKDAKISTKYPEWCDSEFDPILLDEWNDINSDDVVSIKFPESLKGQMTCYDRENLIRFFEEPSSIMFEWFAKSGFTLKPSGKGGYPSGKCFRKEPYMNRFFSSTSSDYLINHPEIKVYKAVYLGMKRLGNWRGSFEQSELHGQEPGFRTYKLIPLKIKN